MTGGQLAPAIVVMGVSGSGKTTVARMLAERLGRVFVDADDLHPTVNVEKMRAGIQLTDADRAPWLDAVAARIAAGREHPVVVACSALKRAYRDVLRGGGNDVTFIYLDAPRSLVEERMAHRKGHFMPAALLDSQYQTLEVPGADERPISVVIGGPPDEVVVRVEAALIAGSA